MSATIIIRSKATKNIVHLHEVHNIDEISVQSTLDQLCGDFPEDRYTIDTSQIEYARQAMVA